MVLLILVPLFLVGLIFSSFNPLGLKKISVGVVTDNEFNIKEFDVVVSHFAYMTEFNDVDGCVSSLKRYEQYVCIEVIDSGNYLLNVYFDNTKEPVIWEVIARIEKAVEYMQKERSKEIAEDVIVKMKRTLDKLTDFKQKLHSTNNKIDIYTSEIINNQNELKTAKQDLSTSLDDMDRDIRDAKKARGEAKSSKDEYKETSLKQVNDLDNTVDLFPASGIKDDANLLIKEVKNEIEFYDNEIDKDLRNVQKRIDKYEESSKKGRGFVKKIDNNIKELQNIEQDLKNYKVELLLSEQTLASIERDFNFVKDLDPELVVNPIVIKNYPTYIPKVDEEIAKKYLDPSASKAEQILTGLNLISLQTIFPTLMLLITLFLSLLISSFVCLSEINSSANTRVQLVRNVFFHEFLSVFISSMTIVIIPFLIIMLLGEFIFLLKIFENIDFVFLIFFLLSGVFVMIGMGISYLLRKESITLLITTFFLVFLIFFSGFLLPIERMTPVASEIASIFPGKLALNIFNKIILYGGDFASSSNDIYLLSLWFLVAFLLVLAIKYFRKN